MADTCKATTASGEQCRLKPGLSGYCHIHDPERIAEREAKNEADQKAWEESYAKGEWLREVVDVVEVTCKAKGWHCEAFFTDLIEWRFATAHVEKYFFGSLGEIRVEATFDISLTDRLQFSIESRSSNSAAIDLLRDAIWSELLKLTWLEKVQNNEDSDPNSDDMLERLISRFHVVVDQLRHRYNGRDTLIVSDEYDVQDLLHALLKMFFDDVRPEEYVPSHAGAASRIDFLLKKEKTVVEAKMASHTLKDKQVGEQLIVDIQRYKSHPDCTTLICFVYDPDRHIRNPNGLKNDLSKKHDDIDVKVLIVPES